ADGLSARSLRGASWETGSRPTTSESGASESAVLLAFAASRASGACGAVLGLVECAAEPEATSPATTRADIVIGVEIRIGDTPALYVEAAAPQSPPSGPPGTT